LNKKPNKSENSNNVIQFSGHKENIEKNKEEKINSETGLSEQKPGFSIQRTLLYGAFIIVLLFIILYVTQDTSFKGTNSVNTEGIPLAGANNFDICGYREGFVLAKDGRISCYNTNQELQWEFVGSKTTPTLKANDKYVLVYYPEDKLAIVTNGKKTNEIKTKGNVSYGYVNKNGYCVLFTKESGLKNKILVYNNNGKQLYMRQNSDVHIPYAILSDDNKTLLTIELSTHKKQLLSNINICDIRQKDKILSQTEFKKETIAGCFFCGPSDFVVISENQMTAFNINGRKKWKKQFDKKILKYDYNSSGVISLLFNEDDSASSGSEVAFFGTTGKKYSSYFCEKKISTMDINDKIAVFGTERRIITANTKGKFLSDVDIPYDVKKVIFMGTKKAVLILTNSNEARLVAV